MNRIGYNRTGIASLASASLAVAGAGPAWSGLFTSGITPLTADYRARINASGGTITGTRLALVDKYLSRPLLQEPALLAKITRLSPLFGDNLAAALVPLVAVAGSASDTGVSLASGDFLPVSGIRGDANAKEINTTVPGNSLSGTNFHCSAYNTTASESGAYSMMMGARTGTNPVIQLGRRFAGEYRASGASSLASQVVQASPGARKSGWIVLSSGASATNVYDDSSPVAAAAAASSQSPTAATFRVLSNGDGTAGSRSQSSIGLYSIGLSLTAGEVATLNAIVQGFMSARLALEGDSDATAYVNALVASGVSPDIRQRIAISSFIAAEKSAGRWTGLRRLYLPIWGNAAANSIDMKTRTSGQFFGGITHSAGSFAGNGTTGYFSALASPVDAGMSISSGVIGCLRLNATGSSKALFGSNGSSSAGAVVTYDWSAGSGMLSDWINDTTGRLGVTGGFNFNGIISASVSGGARHVRCRNAAGVSVTATGTPLGSGSLTTQPAFLGASNNNGTPILFNASSFGAFFMGQGWSSASDDGFTLNLKTLWESCTGLALP